MSQFKAGDVVRLKSGGPSMTVFWDASGEVRVSWFGNHTEKPLWTDMPAEALELVDLESHD